MAKRVGVWLFIIFCLTDCSRVSECLQGKNLFGPFRVIKSQRFQKFFTSEYDRSPGSDIMVSWERTAGEIITSKIPIDKFNTIVDDTVETPRISFVFTSTYLNSEINCSNGDMVDVVKNPNISINGYLVQADVVMNRKTYEEEDIF
ncbi:hypothetical protein COT97_01115 [Candidatus Falkowbacteria bacterium CG10_big_fil_rev_8_21_14_0_10_39_11]|uniref:Uncharacterized protein n=1 Tax=Candidatus Falkowbacteria bacterium CG10_big_fil_rev_8_21_14_0_10_39_11 TaxID=1974565 RepID=A0A2H0V5U2_9BACT|nr:MAG: hypothetical protein COT97_01115 [Candidatus Falkowbacteria bacterium CG10_big_fil_rev_8_21_14_0_10_39_11]